MSFDMHSKIVANDVLRADVLKENKVFRLYSNDGRTLVIKADQELGGTGQGMFKVASKIVASFSEAAKMKLLTPQEIMEICDWASSFPEKKGIRRMFGKQDSETRVKLRKALQLPGFSWMKMQAFESISDAEFLQFRDKYSAKHNRKMMKRFTEAYQLPEGLRRLGRIVVTAQ